MKFCMASACTDTKVVMSGHTTTGTAKNTACALTDTGEKNCTGCTRTATRDICLARKKYSRSTQARLIGQLSSRTQKASST